MRGVWNKMYSWHFQSIPSKMIIMSVNTYDYLMKFCSFFASSCYFNELTQHNPLWTQAQTIVHSRLGGSNWRQLRVILTSCPALGAIKISYYTRGLPASVYCSRIFHLVVAIDIKSRPATAWKQISFFSNLCVVNI